MIDDDGLALAAAIFQAAPAALLLVQPVPAPLQDHGAADCCAQLLDFHIAGHPVFPPVLLHLLLCDSLRYE